MALTLHGTVSDNTVALDRKTATPLIINGDMQIAQRGTTLTGMTNSSGTGYQTVDRFQFGGSGSPFGTWTQSQDTDVPSGQGFANSFKMQCTTSSTDDGQLLFQHRMEGQNLQHIKKGTSNAESLTLSFWVKSNKTGTYIAELYDRDNTRQISYAYTIDSSNTWEKKTIAFAGDTTGTLDNDNARSLDVILYLKASSASSSGTLNTSWASVTTANRAVGQVNLADSTSNYINITGVQLEVGTFDANSIPPFQFEDRATSLARCQRYCVRINATNPYSVFSAGYSNSSTTFLAAINFPNTMRATPTMSSGGTFRVIEGGSGRTVSSVSFDGNSRGLDNCRADVTVNAAIQGNGGMFTASNDLDAFVQADAEL